MDRALALADWKGFGKRKRESKRNGKLRGIGLANYIEIDQRRAARMRQGRRAAGGPRRRRRSARCRAARATRRASRSASPNGSASPFESIRLIQGDTDIVPVGGGSHSGRSMRMAGVVMGKASEAVIEKATQDRRPRAGGRRRRHRVRRGPLHRQGHRPLDRPVRGGARRARAQRPAGRPARAAGRRLRRIHPRSPAFRSAAMSARSRSTRTPA